MRRRLDRDLVRVHAYHDDLRRIAKMKRAALESAVGEKAEADRKRETMRVDAIEREYGANPTSACPVGIGAPKRSLPRLCC